jgi:hypothetical protein
MILAFKKKKPGRKPKQWKLPQVVLPDAKDVFLFGGISAAAYGVYQIYPPSAYILVGGCFIALGLLIYLGGSKHEGS